MNQAAAHSCVGQMLLHAFINTEGTHNGEKMDFSSVNAHMGDILCGGEVPPRGADMEAWDLCSTFLSAVVQCLLSVHTLLSFN